MQGVPAVRASERSEGPCRNSAQPDLQRRQMPQPSPVQDPRERDYQALRDPILAMLKARFPSVREREEIYQEAWAEALEREARGHDLTDPGGLLYTIAWRRARDRLRNHDAEYVDPACPILKSEVDPADPPDEETRIRLDADLIRQVVDVLDDQHAAVIKLRYDRHLSGKEIAHALGVKPKRLENIVTEAYKLVEEVLVPAAGETESEWRRRQRSLLHACEAGIATGRQRRAVQRMIAHDPVCRAMLRQLRASMERIAALLPMPIVEAADDRGPLSRLRLVFGDHLASARDRLADLTSRVPGHQATVEQAGSGGLAGLAGGAAV